MGYNWQKNYMKSISVYVDSLTISFLCDKTDEFVTLEVECPFEPNMEANNVKDSEVCDDNEYTADNGRTYRVEVSKNINEGSVSVYDITDDEPFEIELFDVEEHTIDDDSDM